MIDYEFQTYTNRPPRILWLQKGENVYGYMDGLTDVIRTLPLSALVFDGDNGAQEW